MIAVLRGRFKRIIPYKVEAKSKIERLSMVLPIYQSGAVYYPTAKICPWVIEHKANITTFPSGKFDDEVDCESMALDYLTRNSYGSFDRLLKLDI